MKGMRRMRFVWSGYVGEVGLSGSGMQKLMSYGSAKLFESTVEVEGAGGMYEFMNGEVIASLGWNSI